MKLPVSWLKKYIDFDFDVRDLADRLTDSGSHVESIDCINPFVTGCVTGKIVKLDKHPNADKLKCLKVDIGTEIIDLITGAPNVFEGAIIGLAMNGAVLHEGVVIESTDFRGVLSNGMLLSYGELGFPDSTIPKEYKDGVVIFSDETPLGMNISELLNLNSPIIEFEITPNRPDCLSIEGMARETAAAFGTFMKKEEFTLNEAGAEINSLFGGVEVDTDRCNRYYARIATDITVGESPLWMQNELMQAGMRPINNIVDITNYVMLEIGNPLHAFDMSQLKGGKIVVKNAKSGEVFKTLDGVDRTLSNEDCVITDGVNTLAIGGVMGGLDSEVTNATNSILIEGASFVSSSVRKTSKRLALRTEASTRFEKGIDATLAKRAVDRVCYFIELFNIGKVAKGSVDVYKNELLLRTVNLEFERVNALLGTQLSNEEIIKYLELLELEVKPCGNYAEVIIPAFRGDLERPVDLIEEVGRLFGFHNIERKMLRVDITKGEKPYHRVIGSIVKNVLTGLSYNEVMTYSFMGTKLFDKLMLAENDEKRNFVRIMNPLGEDFSVMRTTLQASMLDVLSRNFAHKEKNVFIYEIGNTFVPSKSADELPVERKLLDIAFYGDKNFYHLKETVIFVLNKLGIKDLIFKPAKDKNSFHPGRTAELFVGEKSLGTVGCIHPNVAKNFDIKSDVYLAEFDFDEIVKLAHLETKYAPLPKFPASSRDLAVVLPADIPAGEIKSIVKAASGDLLESFEVFDIYRGDQIEAGFKSIAFAMKFRAKDRTLVDDEVNGIMSKVLEGLKEKLHARIRE